MGAVSVEVQPFDRATFPSDGKVTVYVNYRLSNSYGPSFETLNASALGLGTIEMIVLSPAVDANASSLSLLPVPLDRAPTSQVRLYVPTATNGQDLSNFTGRFLAIGY